MHQTFFIVYAFLQGDHRFRSADPVDIIYPKDNIFCVVGILCPDLTKDIEFSGRDMGHRNIGDQVQPFQHEFGLVGLF